MDGVGAEGRKEMDGLEYGGGREEEDLSWRRDVKGGSVESEGDAGQDQDGVWYGDGR